MAIFGYCVATRNLAALRGAFTPVRAVHDEDDNPHREGQTAGGQCDEHEPPEDAELIEERAAIDAVDDAGMN